MSLFQQAQLSPANQHLPYGKPSGYANFASLSNNSIFTFDGYSICGSSHLGVNIGS